MKAAWIRQEQNAHLLVFFNGWGMDENPFQGFTSSGLDIVHLYDYRNFEQDFPLEPGLFDSYRKIYVLGWSYGVWISSFFYNLFPAEKTAFAAINGTLFPVHRDFGITPDIFEATLEHFSPDLARKFYRNMFASSPWYQRFCDHLPRRSSQEQAEELAYIRDKLHSPVPRDLPVLKGVLVGTKDKIIFARNQIKFWESRGITCTSLDTGHFPFYLWDGYDTMVKAVFNQ